MNHSWIYRGFEGPHEDETIAHYWVCSRCDSVATNYVDNIPPKSTGMTLGRDRKTLLTCEQKMVENIQVG